MVLERPRQHFEGAGDGAETLAVAGRGSPVRGGASLGGLGEARRVLVHGSGPRGPRPECRDHGPAGDHGASRGRPPARNAGIMIQFMITDHHAGDRPAAARAYGHDSSPARPPRLGCRDHGPAGDHGASRGRPPAWSAGIKDQCMITDHRAGDRPATARACGHDSNPARPPPGTPGSWPTGDHGASRGRPRARSAWIMVGRVITGDHAGRSRAWSAGIMVGRVIAEDYAGGHPPGVPGSGTSAVGEPGGTAPAGYRRSRRDSLPSPGSSFSSAFLSGLPTGVCGRRSISSSRSGILNAATPAAAKAARTSSSVSRWP